MCVGQTFQSNPKAAWPIFTKNTKPQPQSKTALRTHCVWVMCNVSTPMARSQSREFLAIPQHFRFKYQLNRTIWHEYFLFIKTHTEIFAYWTIAKYFLLAVFVTIVIGLAAAVYNDTAHLMASPWVWVYLAKRSVDFLLLFLQHFPLAMRVH